MRPERPLEEDRKREGQATVDVATVVAEDVVVAPFSEVGVAFGIVASFADVAANEVVAVVDAIAELEAVVGESGLDAKMESMALIMEME